MANKRRDVNTAADVKTGCVALIGGGAVGQARRVDGFGQAAADWSEHEGGDVVFGPEGYAGTLARKFSPAIEGGLGS